MHPIKFPVIKLLVLSLEFTEKENPTWSSASKNGNEATSESEGRGG